MKCSVIFPVLESYEAVRRQILWMNKLGMPKDFEVILVDDGSIPPIMGQAEVELPTPNFNFKYGYRADYRPYTKALAINEGLKMAEGEYVWLMAIDWMLSDIAIAFVENYTGDLRIIPLVKYALIHADGELEVLSEKVKTGSHGLSVVKTDRMKDIGGYNDKFIGMYPTGDDLEFDLRYTAKYGNGSFMFGPYIYGFPKDDAIDLLPPVMIDDDIPRGLRPDIFYTQKFKQWKQAELNDYWENYYKPDTPCTEKGFRQSIKR